MKKFFAKLFKFLNGNNTESDEYDGSSKYKPIVFVNKPISDYQSDIVGFESQIDTIKTAINNGANMIGVVADYGAGKSSVSDILSGELLKDDYCNIIKINMWDSISQADSCNTNETASELTKSFLYQLAKGNTDHPLVSKLPSYVNKRLSKGYKTMSFSTISESLWRWLLLSGILFILYEMFNQGRYLFIENIATGYWLDLIHLAMDFHGIFLIFSIISLLIGFRNTSIAFSDWKNSPKNSSDI